MEETTGILVAVGAGVALFLERTPKVKDWMDKQEPVVKRVVVGVTLFLLSVVVYWLGCFTTVVMLACPPGGVWSFVVDLILAIVVSQGVHMLTKRPSNPLGY